MHDVFVRHVVIIPHDGDCLDVIFAEPVILLTCHTIVEQILVHGRAHRITIRQIEREKSLVVVELGNITTLRILRMKIFRRLTLYKRRVRLCLEDRMLGHLIRLAQVFERSDKRAVRSQSFIPPTELCRERRRYLDFVNRREESYPWKTLRKRSRILGEELRKIRVLKILQPVRHAEMTE